jgi:hypothetical protein
VSIGTQLLGYVPRRQQAPPKRRKLFAILHDVICQKKSNIRQTSSSALPSQPATARNYPPFMHLECIQQSNSLRSARLIEDLSYLQGTKSSSKSTLTLSYCLHLDYPNSPFPTRFCTKNLTFPMRAKFPTLLTFLNLTVPNNRRSVCTSDGTFHSDTHKTH